MGDANYGELSTPLFMPSQVIVGYHFISPPDHISTCEKVKRSLVTNQDQDIPNWAKETAILVMLILSSWMELYEPEIIEERVARDR
jgi:hypothetical protein